MTSKASKTADSFLGAVSMLAFGLAKLDVAFFLFMCALKWLDYLDMSWWGITATLWTYPIQLLILVVLVFLAALIALGYQEVTKTRKSEP